MNLVEQLMLACLSGVAFVQVWIQMIRDRPFASAANAIAFAALCAVEVMK